MTRARLTELPSPPSGENGQHKTGWPWTEETPLLPPVMANGAPWPRISVVTPSYNQGAFIEETIRSVLLQGYPNLEYVIFDGGSSDDSADVIRKYEPWLAHWTSERDRGQAHAINKGLDLCTGEIFNWVNSDDVLAPGALRAVGEAMGSERSSDASSSGACDAAAGAVQNFDASGPGRVLRNRNITALNLAGKYNGVAMSQPGVWVRTQKLKDIGAIDESFTCSFDSELLFRYFFHHSKIAYIDAVLINFRLHRDSKTVSRSSVFKTENIAILRKFLRDPQYAALAPHMNRRLKQLFWRRRLGKLLDAQDISLLRKLRIIAAGALAHPRTGFSSSTVKAIKAVLWGA
jgi:glycosyltransferase involved in cell wall biosynthesis